jgi:hypothetical protein
VSDVRLVPRAGVNPTLVWEKAWEVLKRNDLRDYHKCSLAAWILWTGFENHYYQYD